MKPEEDEPMSAEDGAMAEEPSEETPEAAAAEVGPDTQSVVSGSPRKKSEAGTEPMRVYEGMFLVEPSKGRREEDGVVQEITDLIEKHGGKVINGTKWADRDLAYPIHKNHQKYTRAIYFLFHFSAPSGTVAGIERDVQISNWLLRSLVVKDEDGVGLPGDEKGKEKDKEKVPAQTAEGTGS